MFDPDETQPIIAPVLRKLTNNDIALMRSLLPDGSTVSRSRLYHLHHVGLVEKRWVGWNGRHRNNGQYYYRLTENGKQALALWDKRQEA